MMSARKKHLALLNQCNHPSNEKFLVECGLSLQKDLPVVRGRMA